MIIKSNLRMSISGHDDSNLSVEDINRLRQKSIKSSTDAYGWVLPEIAPAN